MSFAVASFPTSVQFLSALYDALLLRVPERHLVSKQLAAGSEEAETAVLRVGWVPNSEVSVDAVIVDILDDYADRLPLCVSFDTAYRDGLRISSVVAVMDKTATENPEGGEPIPPDDRLRFSLAVGSADYDIVNYEGTHFSLLRNGEEIGEAYPSAAAALGALMEYVLLELAEEEGQKGTPNPDAAVDKDFLFSVSQFLADSSIVPNEEVRKRLVDFVEITTKRAFDS